MKKHIAIPAHLIGKEIYTDAEREELSKYGDQPMTDEEIAQMQSDEETNKQAAIAYENRKHNEIILFELEQIDRKSIRAMREGNEERLNALEAEAALLRGQLK
jgi:hypothetical protein